jgi:hypothetical protein
VAELTADAATVAKNLAAVQDRIAAACARSGRNPDGVRICVATKYVGAEGMRALADAGVKIAAENRLQDMIVKQEQFADDFEWHFIGAIQSRKVREIAARVAVIHSLASESARDKLRDLPGTPPKVLTQVNVAGEESKAGIDPTELDAFVAASPIAISGLMTMPPLSSDPEAVRPHFRALAELAATHNLSELSIGTTQDFEIAVEEGATLVRIGSALFAS